MRSVKKFLGNIDSSFLSCEKDTELIIRKLFIDSGQYSDELKRLLLINTDDCLDDRTNQAYLKKVRETSLSDLIEQGYIKLVPKLKLKENEEVKNYILITYDNFSPTSNLEYRDCTIMIDIICNTDYWYIGNYRVRPLKIAGYIDGILNKTRLTGIGTLEFIGCNEIVLTEDLSGYCLVYRAVHGDEDTIPFPEEPDEEEE